LLFHLNRGRRSRYDHFAADDPIAPGVDDFLPGFGGGGCHNRLSFTRG
jgi:hypothetical protein